MSDKLWDLGNIITGFSVLQSVAVIYFCLQNTVAVHLWSKFMGVAALVGLVSAGVYVAALWACFQAEMGLRRADKEAFAYLEVCKNIFVGRLVTIVSFHSLAIAMTLIAWKKFG